ncbi:Dot/Icm secretion system substrate [Legionella wadsworthii]|uniref:Dot/Icm secretion system substrate n=1 Tax=Legionella wadsworthii TaxID=28088 RepID=A0A378LTT8_9GAMM|nr:hypothetical protein [Legionella wadsworthii]STY30836.1 Dot/Icm secretion system substrate [Legionella wadsworthii]
MTGSKIQSFDLFKAAMGNQEFLAEINKDKVNQTFFLKTLEEGNLTLQNILEFIKIVKDQKVKSLLIIYVLSQKEFFSCLKGESLLKRLTHQDHHIPSRLNFLIHQLDAKTLTTALISRLEPEAAISILCSVPHFHQLTRIQIEALFERYPLYERHQVLTYWINHYVSMPNSHYILAHLMNIAGHQVLDELSKLTFIQKELIIKTMIEHLGLFNHIPTKFIEHANQEPHLIASMRFYLHGHYNKAHANFIKLLSKKLFEKNHSFSLEAIELFFFLNDKLEFRELSKRTSHLTNRFLRNNAINGNVSLFYHNNRINIQRMLQNIYLQPTVSEGKKLRQSAHPDENPFINGLIKHDKSINCFEYFLIHYKGNSNSIGQLINDYLEYYERPEHATSRIKAIYHIGFMLGRPEIDDLIKDAIFTAFLNHPAFFDQQISYQLFLFDAKRTLRFFGLRGGIENYQRVIKLCTLALKNLHPETHYEIIEMAQKALSEAQCELNLSKEQGIFSSIIRWFKRCWIYGWSGFFKPNLPEYVVPNSITPLKNEKDSMLDGTIIYTEIQEQEENLPELLNEIKLPTTQEHFEQIIRALTIYSLSPLPKEEFMTRKKIHDLYHEALNKKEENEDLYVWLKDNQTPFINNQFHLLELMFKEKSRNEIDAFLAQVNEDSDHLQYVSEELEYLLPELIMRLEPKPKEPETSGFVSTATKVISEYTCEAGVLAQNALHWAEGFFNKIKTTEQEEEPFEVEHIESFQNTIGNKGVISS